MGTALALASLFLSTAWGPGVLAQQTPNPPQLQQRQDAPQSTPANVPAAPPEEQPLSEYQQSQMRAWANDFAGLARYRAANAVLRPPSAGVDRVVFFGDSITDGWNLDQSFPGRAYINRGISGQTTSQMLLRFRQDVIALQPKVVVVLAGTNDIAGNTGPISLKDIEANLMSIAELARAHNISVIFSSIMPVNNYVPASIRFFNQRPQTEIIDLNAWLRDYCASNGHWYLNYYNAMLDENGMLRRDISNDGLHPNDAGYKIMAPLAQAMIERAIAR
ncbi:MAG: SGNH/GDSL hydrolase family protein [Acidobacteriaceae bacterium]